MEGDILTRQDIEQLRLLVEENKKLAADNNHLLRRMQYWGRVAFWAKVVVWTVVLILPFLLYSYIAPILHLVPGAANASSTGASLFGFPSPTEVQHLLRPQS